MIPSQPFPSPKLESSTSSLESSSDVLILGVCEDDDGNAYLDSNGDLPKRLVEHLTQRKLISAKLGEVNKLVFPNTDGPSLIVCIGVGKTSDRTRDHAFDSAATAVRSINAEAQGVVDIALANCFAEETHDSIVAGILNACENQSIYQTTPKEFVPETLRFIGVGHQAIERGRIIGEAMIHLRRLVNEPPSEVYPESFAVKATEIAKASGLAIEVWDENRLETEGCRAILAVGAGSSKPPRLVIMRHQGGGAEPPLAFVGKGVTFDSGGLSLKPSDSMADMKCDMAGAATVVGLMHAISRLGIKRNVIGICGLAENMVSGTSYKLGDVIETRSGKTIEILNTDAEGRVVLADTLNVANDSKPSAIIDLATLTGACMVALGTEVAGLMTNNQTLCDSVRDAAGKEGEPVWQLPMFELYDEKVKSKVADIKNVGEGRWGGAITAAKFLENFVDATPWLHIDIAGPSFVDSARPHRDAGATGVMLRSLLRWVET
ncbi:Cytosol aminopeptidase [Novipirellula aureliae]|uniref:Probable cytosol aminopeptidase n=1 Tax=Novipirellula aureliae TaxID=2527966 RepID=A0A5C6DNR1_9BACT|nr:leucyl aminopeptidase [Novipirellula aureliae]TWU38923.1 Cytosol aminopeptidase [Novipirellula aureliae]